MSRDYSPEETTARGEAIYAQQIREKVEREHWGEFLVLDVKTGHYEIAPDDLTATKLALAHCADGVLYGLRIGSPAAYRLGGRFAVLS
jgi:hypothetical protein